MRTAAATSGPRASRGPDVGAGLQPRQRRHSARPGLAAGKPSALCGPRGEAWMAKAPSASRRAAGASRSRPPWGGSAARPAGSAGSLGCTLLTAHSGRCRSLSPAAPARLRIRVCLGRHGVALARQSVRFRGGLNPTYDPTGPRSLSPRILGPRSRTLGPRSLSPRILVAVTTHPSHMLGPRSLRPHARGQHPGPRAPVRSL